jgi:hypothetical protein
MRIRIDNADGPLALLAPINVDDSYQLFAGGRLIGSFGDFDRPVPTIYVTRPLMFAPPNPDSRKTMLLAFRFYMSPYTMATQTLSGGMHTAPVIGLSGAITAAWHVAWEDQYRAVSSALAAAIVFAAFAVLILMLYAFDRTETTLLWPLGACVVFALYLFLIFLTGTTQVIPQLQATILESVLGPVFVGLWLTTWWAYSGLQDKNWIRNTIIAVVLWSIAAGVLFQVLSFGGNAGHGLYTAHVINGFAVSFVHLLLLAVIAYFGLRRSHRENWMLFPAIFFYAVADLTPILRMLHLRTVWFPFGIIVQLSLLSAFASLFCFLFVLLGRFRASQRRQQAIAEDVKQAQQVQQVLIPEELPQIFGLAVESEYRPAREVGGDFFQIIPDAIDGSALIVVGDVTGKGLQAGMLVALIVGAIRAEAAHSNDPLSMIASLNQRLCGRGNAHATCLALRIAADGSATLANAGHMPPYLNGKELPMQGAVPLGISPTAEFSVMRFHLQPDDRLMLLSDGVAEAQDKQGRLFGFDRIHALLEKPITAAQIAAAAQSFGQQDDISVLSITRAPALKAALA